jgi:hypothetical protein
MIASNVAKSVSLNLCGMAMAAGDLAVLDGIADFAGEKQFAARNAGRPAGELAWKRFFQATVTLLMSLEKLEDARRRAIVAGQGEKK